jgi:hypothetical protein
LRRHVPASHLYTNSFRLNRHEGRLKFNQAANFGLATRQGVPPAGRFTAAPDLGNLRPWRHECKRGTLSTTNGDSGEMKELLFQSATEAAEVLRRKEVSSRELTEKLLEGIDAVNPAVNAVVEVRREAALQEAASGAKPTVSRSRSASGTTEVRVRVGERSTRGAARRAAAKEGAASLAGLASQRTAIDGRRRFRIRFHGESVFAATDIRDALRQAESLGATEITAVTRQD